MYPFGSCVCSLVGARQANVCSNSACKASMCVDFHQQISTSHNEKTYRLSYSYIHTIFGILTKADSFCNQSHIFSHSLSVQV